MEARRQLNGPASVIKIQEAAKDVYLMDLSVPWMSSPEPGQFVQVSLPNADGMILPRPISVNGFWGGVLRLAVAVKGEGTRRLCASECGCALNLTGPLGNGFVFPPGIRKAAAVGGGIGAAPLLYAVQKHPEIEWCACLGFRGREYAYQLEQWQNSSRPYLSTDDGTLGMHGLVTQPLIKALEEHQPDLMICCGPVPMMRAVAEAMKPYPRIQSQISLEARMGCGIGACLTCSCKIYAGDDWDYKRVCADGPVFALREVFPDA